MLSIIQKRKIWYIFSGTLCLLSILSLIFWGLKPAIDFTGGTLMEVKFKTVNEVKIPDIRESLGNLNLGQINIQSVGENGVIFKLKNINEEDHQKILQTLNDKFSGLDSKEAENISLQNVLEEVRFESIGPLIGKELFTKAKWSILLVSLAIVIYIAYAFKKISKPVASWKYGLGAIIALIHDLLIVTGVFSVLGHFYGIEVDALFITALLTVLGYSVNDTIVVYDRTRENLKRYPGEGFENLVNRSVNETMARSINTTLTTLFPLFAILFLGGETIRHFTLALVIGITFGAYSSIFIASTGIVTLNQWRIKRIQKARS